MLSAAVVICTLRVYNTNAILSHVLYGIGKVLENHIIQTIYGFIMASFNTTNYYYWMPLHSGALTQLESALARLALKASVTTAEDNILIFLENKVWHFMWIICLADDSFCLKKNK